MDADRQETILDPGLTGQDARPVPGVDNGYLAGYRVRFDEAGPDGWMRTSSLLRYAQDVAWRHSEHLGFDRAWYLARGLGWVVRGVELELHAPVPMGQTLRVSTAVVGHRRIWARRLGDVPARGRPARGARHHRLGAPRRAQPDRAHPDRLRRRLPEPGDGQRDPPRRLARRCARRIDHACRPACRPRPARSREQRGLRRLVDRGPRCRGLGHPGRWRPADDAARVPGLRGARQRGHRRAVRCGRRRGARGFAAPTAPSSSAPRAPADRGQATDSRVIGGSLATACLASMAEISSAGTGRAKK